MVSLVTCVAESVTALVTLTSALPVMVCAEGFLLSHTSEVVEVPGQDEVDAFLPPFAPPHDRLLDPADPRRLDLERRLPKDGAQ